MSVFSNMHSLQKLNELCLNTAVAHMGIRITEMTSTSLSAEMPVDKRTIQPAGLVHGGCYALLAESLAGLASMLLLENTDQMPVGIEVTAKHVKSAREGIVKGKIQPVHLGSKLHLWEIRMTNSHDQLLSIATVTNQIIQKKS